MVSSMANSQALGRLGYVIARKVTESEQVVKQLKAYMY